MGLLALACQHSWVLWFWFCDDLSVSQAGVACTALLPSRLADLCSKSVYIRTCLQLCACCQFAHPVESPAFWHLVC